MAILFHRLRTTDSLDDQNVKETNSVSQSFHDNKFGVVY